MALIKMTLHVTNYEKFMKKFCIDYLMQNLHVMMKLKYFLGFRVIYTESKTVS